MHEDVSVKRNREGVFVYSPHFKFGKGFALPYGEIGVWQGIALIENGTEDSRSVKETLKRNELLEPTTEQLVHALSFVPIIPDEDVQLAFMGVLYDGLFSFDRCFLDCERRDLYLVRREVFRERGAFMGKTLAERCNERKEGFRSIDISDRRYGERGISWSFKKKYRLGKVRLGMPPMSDVFLGEKGIEDLKSFLDYSAPRVLEVYVARGNSDRNVETQIAEKLVEAINAGFPPWYNEFQPDSVTCAFTMDDERDYLGDSVEGEVTLKLEKTPDYEGNRDYGDYIPQLDPTSTVKLQADFWKFSSAKTEARTIGIIP